MHLQDTSAGNASAPAAGTAPVSASPLESALAAAGSAGLRYTGDDAPGITRRRSGDNFEYFRPDGRPVEDEATLQRIRGFAIPPAWTDVWICPQANGHLQATGRDARRRKQYRYHANWHSVRDEAKYERMIAFGKALPEIRRRVARDAARPGLGKTRVLAAMVKLLETTLIRVGNEEYARQNQSFGLSTMRDRHVKIRQGTLRFSFRGKSGVKHGIELHDPRLAEIVRRTQELPGQDLFQYEGADGRPHRITSDDVNAYLREIAGAEFTAKDFRTWAGTVLAAVALKQFELFDNKAEAKRNLLRAIETVASRLGNTPSVCKKCYIHPVVLQSYLDGETVEILQRKAESALRSGLSKLKGEEAAVLAFLQQKLQQDAPSPAPAKGKPGAPARPRRPPKKKEPRRGADSGADR